eukprot:49327-Eustigmatos_ZCMA.PRE.1
MSDVVQEGWRGPLGSARRKASEALSSETKSSCWHGRARPPQSSSMCCGGASAGFSASTTTRPTESMTTLSYGVVRAASISNSFC